ncbi:MAG: 2-phosphosulfolactate phosphatase [Gammaproteobacteria bacterium]
MQIEVMDFVEGARKARGVAVVIDVFRAFSVACYAYARGAKRIIPVAEIDKALSLKRDHPEYLAIGERGGRKVEGFDFGNSPTEISQTDVRGKTLVQTTSAGTQGLTNADQADVVLTGSLVNAAAICAYIESLKPERVSIVRMGLAAKERCAEDDLCAEVLRGRLSGNGYDVSGIRDVLRTAPAARKFFDPQATWAPEGDFELCTDVDRFGFVLRLSNGTQGSPYLEKINL